MRILKVLLTAFLCATLLACQEDKSSAPAPGAKPRGESNPPEQQVSCERYNEFFFIFTSMEAHAAVLSAIDEDANRIALASALFAEYMKVTYIVVPPTDDDSWDPRSYYLNLFSLIFESDGQVRTTPAHPLTEPCQGKE